MFTSKIKVRKELILKLETLSEVEILRQSNSVCNKILKNEQFQKANTISVYLSMQKEIQTTQLLEMIFQQGKQCFIPRFQTGSSEMEMIRLNSINDFYNLPLNKWNIRQPPSNEARESVFDRGSLDLVLTPGLGFTATGKRLGRGKGYYDKFLARCAAELLQSPFTMGLAFNEQLLPDLPTSQHDICMDLVISENS